MNLIIVFSSNVNIWKFYSSQSLHMELIEYLIYTSHFNYSNAFIQKRQMHIRRITLEMLGAFSDYVLEQTSVHSGFFIRTLKFSEP